MEDGPQGKKEWGSVKAMVETVGVAGGEWVA